MFVSFDFDSTLTKPVKETLGWGDDTFWASSNEPQPETVHRAKELASEGHDVLIVTSRDATNATEVFDFVNEHRLDVVGVKFTGGDLKAETLSNLDVDVHFDDSFSELEAIEETNVDGRLVPHPHDVEENPEQVENFQTANFA